LEFLLNIIILSHSKDIIQGEDSGYS
jgi:hypothetical protein